jgi:hypothetical protein
MDGVKDGETADAAAPQVQAIAIRLKGLTERAKKLDPISEAEQAAVDKLKDEMKLEMERMVAHRSRLIGSLELQSRPLQEAIKEMNWAFSALSAAMKPPGADSPSTTAAAPHGSAAAQMDAAAHAPLGPTPSASPIQKVSPISGGVLTSRHLTAAPNDEARAEAARIWVKVDFKRNYQRLSQHFGADKVVTVLIFNITPEIGKQVIVKISEESGVEGFSGDAYTSVAKVVLAPVEDIQSVADKLTIGQVNDVDPEARIITITVDPSKFTAAAATSPEPPG